MTALCERAEALPKSPRPTRAEIHLGAIAHNFEAIRAKVGPRVRIMGIVKADAYGHGAVPVARVLAAKGAAIFGVAILDEALELREAGIREPILILGALLPREIEPAIRHDIALTISDRALLREVANRAKGRKVGVHLKIDTGMGRLGVSEKEAVSLALEIASLPELSLQSVFTHFPSSDETDREFTLHQIRRFNAICDEIERCGIRIPLRHAANSGAVLQFPESYMEMVRPGIAMYGLYPSPECARTIELHPAMTLKSQVAFLKTVEPGQTLSYGRTFTAKRRMLVAIVPIGYADGFERRHSNRGAALVRGRRVPLVGRVCMDQALFDVSDVPGVALGDEVVLYGRQGEETISIEDVAVQLGTIPNEIVCAVGKRVPRIYLT